MSLIRDILKIDAQRESAIVQDFMSQQTKGTPKKDGLIVGVSGGIDSAVIQKSTAFDRRTHSVDGLPVVIGDLLLFFRRARLFCAPLQDHG